MWAAWPILSASAALCGLFLAGGLSGKSEYEDVRRKTPVAPVGEPLCGIDAPGLLETEIRALLNQELPLAAQQFTRLEMAVAPGLPLHWDEQALARALRPVIRSAIMRSEGGRVLVTATRHGGRIRIGVSDDAQPADRALEEARLREPQELFALMGATLEIDLHGETGRTVAIRLPEPGPLHAEPPPKQQQAAHDPAPQQAIQAPL